MRILNANRLNISTKPSFSGAARIYHADINIY